MGWGSPTLFLTFSCAEYDSPDITEYLRRVNNVSSHCKIGRLCTEDPISVSRKFSFKFHAFFRKVLLNGEVLGKVDHKAVDNFLCLGVLRKHFASVNKYAATSDAYITQCN